MKRREIEPLKLAIRFDPPLLALLYTKGGERKYLHEFPLNEEDLCASPQEVVASLLVTHPGYLDKISSEQIVRLIEKVQQQFEQDPRAGQPVDMEDVLRDIQSRMTPEQYAAFLEKLESGELAFESDYEEEDEDIDQMEQDVRRLGGLDDEEEDRF